MPPRHHLCMMSTLSDSARLQICNSFSHFGGRDAANVAELGKKRKDALAASGRRARKKLGMPVPNCRARFKERCWSSDLNQHYRGGSHRNRSRGVHGNAKRATVGGIFVGMDVRYLRHGHERKQEKTHNSHGRQST